MRKFIVSLVAVSVLGLGGAFAQVVTTDADFRVSTQYIGGSFGFPGLQGYYHSEEMDFVGPDSDVRFRLSISPFFGLGLLGGVDVLFDLNQFGEDQEFTLYAGGGPALGFMTTGVGSGLTVDVTGLVGVDYRLNQELSLFFEGGAGFGYWAFSGIGGGFMPAFRSGLGLNYHF